MAFRKHTLFFLCFLLLVTGGAARSAMGTHARERTKPDIPLIRSRGVGIRAHRRIRGWVESNRV
jgi:hypothetical protein